ncbi:MAG: 16S rRNA (uracil(1498)-N(3))-methyltransferase [Agromyces sp.]
MAHQYAIPTLEHVAVGDTVTLTGAEAKHAATVSRVRIGEAIRVANGRGLLVRGEVTSATPSEVAILAQEVTELAPNRPELWLVQALAKGDRDELAVQAATELGVDRVIPWAAARSVSRWDAAKAAKGRARWQSIVDEAAKQSLRAWTPEVTELHTTAQLAALAAATRMVVCVPNGEHPLGDMAVGDGPICLVVGPEGGIEPAEITTLSDAGAQTVRLGTEVLRTSTAGPAAIAVLANALGRWA